MCGCDDESFDWKCAIESVGITLLFLVVVAVLDYYKVI